MIIDLTNCLMSVDVTTENLLLSEEDRKMVLKEKEKTHFSVRFSIQFINTSQHVTSQCTLQDKRIQFVSINTCFHFSVIHANSR